MSSRTVIPTPEVYDIEDLSYYSDLYPPNIKMPTQLIYMQPFSMEADVPDYDMDSEDERWVNSQASRLELTPDKFEEMIDRLEKGSSLTVAITLQEAKAIIQEDDDLIIAVYDYWLNKRLKTQHPLIPQVRKEAIHGVTSNNPYIAFRRRTDRIQTRRNRKYDESSYEKMLKLKRDLTRTLTLIEMVRRREESKQELLQLSIEVFEKRCQAGQIVSKALQQCPARPALTPIFQPNSLSYIKEDTVLSSLTPKEKRQYKKRRHKSGSKVGPSTPSTSGNSVPLPDFSNLQGFEIDVDAATSEEETAPPASPPEVEEEDEGPYAFRPKPGCIYLSPQENPSWPFCQENENGIGDPHFTYYPTSLPINGEYKFVGFTRRRIGRGGRVMLDRINCHGGFESWHSVVSESMMSSSTTGNSESYPSSSQQVNTEVNVDVLTDTSPDSPPVAYPLSPQLGCLHFRPKTPDIMLGSQEMFDSLSQTSSMDFESSSLDDQEEIILPKLPSEENSSIGEVMPGEDQPFLFNAHGLQPDPSMSGDPLSMLTDCPIDSVLLNELSADALNSSYFMEVTPAGNDFGFNNLDGDSSLNSLDAPVNILSGEDVEESSSGPLTSFCTVVIDFL